MATNEPTAAAPTPKRPPLLARLLAVTSNVLFSILMFVLIVGFGVALFLMWPAITNQVQQRLTGATAPTATVAAPAGTLYQSPVALPLQNPGGSYNSQAAADAAYATAVAGAEWAQPVPNQNNLPADAPLVEYGSRTNERAPAGENVPTAEPIPQTDDQNGTKQKEPVNIQETKTCLHGQVWTDTGCHRPTPVQ